MQSANRATQQLLRVDDEDPHPLSPKREQALAARLEQVLDGADGILVSDMNKGLLTPAILRRLVEAANWRPIPIIIDPPISPD